MKLKLCFLNDVKLDMQFSFLHLRLIMNNVWISQFSLISGPLERDWAESAYSNHQKNSPAEYICIRLLLIGTDPE